MYFVIDVIDLDIIVPDKAAVDVIERDLADLDVIFKVIKYTETFLHLPSNAYYN